MKNLLKTAIALTTAGLVVGAVMRAREDKKSKGYITLLENVGAIDSYPKWVQEKILNVKN